MKMIFAVIKKFLIFAKIIKQDKQLTIDAPKVSTTNNKEEIITPDFKDILATSNYIEEKSKNPIEEELETKLHNICVIV